MCCKESDLTKERFRLIDVLADPGNAKSAVHACAVVNSAISEAVHGAAQVWVLAAQFEVRQLRLDKARTIMGMALGMSPKHRLFKAYIDIELQLGNIERCRKYASSSQPSLPLLAHVMAVWQM